MTTLRTSATLPVVAMRSAGDFDAMWREMSQTDARVWTIAHAPLPQLYSTWEPRIEIVEQEEAYLLRAALPGMQRDDITVECHDGMLIVRGEQSIESGVDDVVPRTKHGYRAFARRFILSEPVEADAMTMTYTHGVLEVHLPKAVEVVGQQSPVHATS
jgi:HSP20 family molecular chaperone IbpA